MLRNMSRVKDPVGFARRAYLPAPFRRDPFNDIFRDVERNMRDAARRFEDMERSMFGSNGGARWLPSFLRGSGSERNIPIETKDDGSRLYRTRFDMSAFEPENVNVAMSGRTVTVSAKYEGEKSGMKTSENYCYEFSLPEDVDPEVVKSYIDESGLLCIEAPLPKLEAPPKPKVHELKIERGSADEIASGQASS